MARELDWLENSNFAAWGCAACGWIIPNPSTTPFGKPSVQVKEAFNQHKCSKFPRRPSPPPDKRKTSAPKDYRE
jgi:hypothetical protein